MEKILDNGTLISTPVGAPHPDVLLRSNYIYAAVNTVAHEPLYLSRHISLAVESYEKLYGRRIKYDIGDMRGQIRRLLSENNMPRLGNIVNIYFIPPAHPETENPEILISWYRSTIYSGYELLSLRAKAVLTNYEIPFSGHRTAISLTTSDYMQQFAERSGNHIALHLNRAERLVSCGDFPVFIVNNGTVFTSPAPDCVERYLMNRACQLAGINMEEREITSAELVKADEIMVFNHTGIQSVLSLGDRYFYNITALRLEKTLQQITSEGVGL